VIKINYMYINQNWLLET